MFSVIYDDICFCGNAQNCPKQKECRRGQSLIGIHTYSNFYIENEECEYFLKKKGVGKYE